jgi:hypothetical protein
LRFGYLNFVFRIYFEFIISYFEFVPIRYTHTASRPDLSGEMSVANRDLVIVSWELGFRFRFLLVSLFLNHVHLTTPFKVWQIPVICPIFPIFQAYFRIFGGILG